MDQTLKAIRKRANLTQAEAAKLVGVSLRTYKTYENDESKRDSLKYRFITNELEKQFLLDEEHGILNLDEIKKICQEILKEYPVSYCYLFGSYAKGIATEESDIDLLVSSEVRGLAFYGLVERLRVELCKKVDLLNSEQLVNNPELLENILKDGIKIYYSPFYSRENIAELEKRAAKIHQSGNGTLKEHELIKED